MKQQVGRHEALGNGVLITLNYGNIFIFVPPF